MRISNNTVRQTSVNSNFQVRTNQTDTVGKNYDAFRVELSTRALLSDAYNSTENHFPIHDSDALQYTKQMRIIYNND